MGRGPHQPYTPSTQTLPVKHCLGSKQIPLAHQQPSSTEQSVKYDSLVSHLPAINLFPKIAAEPWGIFIADTQAFSVLKDCKENFLGLACVLTDAILHFLFENSPEQ